MITDKTITQAENMIHLYLLPPKGFSSPILQFEFVFFFVLFCFCNYFWSKCIYQSRDQLEEMQIKKGNKNNVLLILKGGGGGSN